MHLIHCAERVEGSGANLVLIGNGYRKYDRSKRRLCAAGSHERAVTLSGLSSLSSYDRSSHRKIATSGSAATDSAMARWKTTRERSCGGACNVEFVVDNLVEIYGIRQKEWLSLNPHICSVQRMLDAASREAIHMHTSGSNYRQSDSHTARGDRHGLCSIRSGKYYDRTGRTRWRKKCSCSCHPCSGCSA